MPAIYSGADGLDLEAPLTFELIVLLDRLGEIPGVMIEHVAGRNGEGIGYLACVGSDKGLAWKAPGSTMFGPPVIPTADESYLLEDGLDTGKWLRVFVVRDHLVAGSECRVYLRDRHANEIGGVDVTAEQAAAGNELIWSFKLANASAVTFHRVKVWIDPAVTGLALWDSGWVAPTTEETAVVLADMAHYDETVLAVRRTIAAGAPADPKVLNYLHFSFMRA